MASSSSCSSRASSSARRGMSRSLIRYDSQGSILCECGIPTVKRVAKTSKNYGRAFWGCSNYKNDNDRGCGYCLFLGDNFDNGKALEGVTQMRAKLMEKEAEIRKLQALQGRLECIIEYKNSEIVEMTKKINRLFICLGVAILVITVMSLST